MPMGVRTSGHMGEKNRHFHRQDMERRKSGMRVLGVTAGETAITYDEGSIFFTRSMLTG